MPSGILGTGELDGKWVGSGQEVGGVLGYIRRIPAN